ncbi:MAG: UDP-3-O-(3-hydroxymyristoyl)glucosamine N-acyltransferase [Tepidisphaeraceae bacterium]
MPTLTLTELSTLLNAPLDAGLDGSRVIARMTSLADAGADALSFLNADRHVDELRACKAAAVLVGASVKLPADAVPAELAVLRVKDADLASAIVLEKLSPPPARPCAGVHPTASIDPAATLGEGVCVGPHVVVSARVKVGARTVLHPGVVIGEDCTVGDDCELYANVVLRERITLGNKVILHAGCVIGTDGFGYRFDGKRHVKLPHVGGVVIEDEVEIGSCTCVDRGKFGDTVIGHGTKIDNLVQIGHNVRVGMHAILCGQAGVAGSSTLGPGVVLGAKVGVKDHVTIGPGVMAAAMSGIASDIPAKSVVGGAPAQPIKDWMREEAALRKLPEVLAELRQLRREVRELKRGNGSGSPE